MVQWGYVFRLEAYRSTSGNTCTINDSDIRGLIGKSSGATMSFSEWYGASATTTKLYRLQLTTNYTELTGKNFAPATVQLLIHRLQV